MLVLLHFPDRAEAALQALIATTMAFGVANRVLYKMALVPLGDYVFFLAQFQTFGYGPSCNRAYIGC